MDGFPGADIIPTTAEQIIGPDAVAAVDNQTTETVQQCDQLLAELQTTIDQAVADCALECELSAQGCQTCITRWFSARQAGFTSLLNQCYGVMSESVLIQLQEASAAAALAGIGRQIEAEPDAVPVTTVATEPSGIAVDPLAADSTGIPPVSIAPANVPAEVVVQVCPPGWLPVTTADGRLVCVQEGTPPAAVQAVIEGRANAPTPEQIIAAIPPASPSAVPTATPATAQQGPSGATGTTAVAPLVQTEGPDSFNRVCINGQWIGVNEARQRFPELASTPFSFLATERLSRVAYWEITGQSLPPGWTRTTTVRESGNYDYTFTPHCAISGPPAATGATGGCPRPTPIPPEVPIPHAFCDPNRLPIPAPGTGGAAAALAASFPDVFSAGRFGFDVGAVLPQEFAANFLAGFWGGATDATGKLIASITENLLSRAYSFISGGACVNSDFINAAAHYILPRFLGQFLRLIPDVLLWPSEYTINYLCPSIIPTGPELNTLRSRGWINEAQWEGAIRANGLCVPWQRLVVDASHWVPTPGEAASWVRRGFVSYDDFKLWCTRNGVKDDADMAVIFSGTEQQPGVSDLIRWMTRDAFDQAVVDQYQLEQDFDRKYTGPARDIGKALGYSDENVRREWVSHWDIPSNTALYDMLHRLFKPWKVPGEAVEHPPVTVEDVRRAIKTNDMSPGWVDALLAISYRPLSNTDVRRGYEIGLIKEAELVDRFRQAGSSPEDAEILAEFAKREAGPIKAKREGFIPKDTVLKDYRDGILSQADAKASLALAGVPSEYVDQFLATEDYKRRAETARKEVASLRLRFIRGEFQPGQAVAELTTRGIAGEAALMTVRQWSAARESKFKAATVRMLCRWWGDGLLSREQFTERIRNLHFPLEDALKIVQTCQADKEARIAKELKAAQKEAASESRRQRAEIKAAAREAARLRKELAPCKPPPKPVCGEQNGQAGGSDGQDAGPDSP